MINQPQVTRYERIVEISTWAVIILVLFAVRFLPQDPLHDDRTFLLIGGILAFALLYYMIIYRYFSKTNRLYLKTISDIVFIGILIHLLKDYGQFFYALYFLPVAAAALSLELINALLIATIASLFIAVEIFLGAQDILPTTSPAYQGIWQIGFIVFITIFCRSLAVQLKQEQRLRGESLARQKVLEEEAKQEKEFLSLTSHQLYTPTSIIRGFSSLMKEDDQNLTPKQKDAVEEIYASSKRMADLVSELLSISRIQAGSFRIKLAYTDINDLLHSIIKQISLVKPNKEVDIIPEISGASKPIDIDSEKIRMVIYNLLDNALKYSKEGEVTLHAHQTDKETVISIKDEGVGIPKEDYDKLFQPFFRGKNILELDNKGTGLGLYVARLIIEKHGGKIWVESGLDKGSKFIFSLPNRAIKKENE